MHQLLRMLISHSVFKVQTHDLNILPCVGTDKESKVAINQIDLNSDDDLSCCESAHNLY